MKLLSSLFKSLLKTVSLAVVLTAGIAASLYWYQVGGRWVTTENAYVKAQMIAVSADVDGRVAKIFVGNNQYINKGDLLFELDKEQYEIALAGARAELAKVRQQVNTYHAQYRLGLVENHETEERVRFFNVKYERFKKLKTDGTSTLAQVEEAEHNLQMARAQFDVMKQRNAMALVDLGGDASSSPEGHPLFLKAQADLEQAERNLRRTSISAPAAGYLTNVNLESGEYVESGDPVFSLVMSDHPWVEANLKESQLTNVVVGQHATVAIDAYPETLFESTVESISPATGAEFALLPPQNATGNWVKVVQRIPVRLRVDVPEGAPILRAGMTVSVSIDTEQERDVYAIVEDFMGKAMARVAEQKE